MIAPDAHQALGLDCISGARYGEETPLKQAYLAWKVFEYLLEQARSFLGAKLALSRII